MSRILLNKEDYKTACELADLYYRMDVDCRMVNGEEKERLYTEKAKNKDIHYKALELVKARFRKQYKGRGR
jgi:hypothetical protein